MFTLLTLGLHVCTTTSGFYNTGSEDRSDREQRISAVTFRRKAVLFFPED